MLRPSKFQISTTDSENAGNSLLKPSKFSANMPEDSNSGSNPFFRASNNTSIDEDSSNNAFGVTTTAGRANDDGKSDENADPLSKLTRANELPKSNLFRVKSTISDDSGFVFGQNISERVVGTNETATNAAIRDNEATSGDNNGAVGGGGMEASSSDNRANEGASVSMLFSAGLNSNHQPSEGLEKKEVDNQSLLEATKKYEERCKVQKRKYEEVETKTGEEGERNICEINCKIFAFVSSNYEERGRGVLRLNDSKTNSVISRVVFRMSGNHRVLLNTKVWQGMTVEKASNKTLRMTAIDSEGHVKVFLVMARPDDISLLYKHLSERVKRVKAYNQEIDNEVDDISPVKVRIVDTSLNTNNEDSEVNGTEDNMSTNSETGECESTVKAVPVTALSTVSANSNDCLSELASSESQSDSLSQ